MVAAMKVGNGPTLRVHERVHAGRPCPPRREDGRCRRTLTNWRRQRRARRRGEVRGVWRRGKAQRAVGVERPRWCLVEGDGVRDACGLLVDACAALARGTRADAGGRVHRLRARRVSHGVRAGMDDEDYGRASPGSVFYTAWWCVPRPGSMYGALWRHTISSAVVKRYIVYAVRTFIDCQVSMKITFNGAVHVFYSRQSSTAAAAAV